MTPCPNCNHHHAKEDNPWWPFDGSCWYDYHAPDVCASCEQRETTGGRELCLKCEEKEMSE